MGKGVTQALRATAFTILVATSLAACSGPPKPDRVVSPDVVGLIESSSHDPSHPGRAIVQLAGGETLAVDNADELFGSGPGEGRVLLYGEADGRVWSASLSIRETAATPGCYTVFGAAAYDEADAVVLVFSKMRDVGVRLPKADSFVVPSFAVSSNGRYAQGEVGKDYGTFCVNPEGLVFGMPNP